MRSEDPAEVRPELNHASNASTIVGRRLLRRAATTATQEGERLLEEARQRLTLVAKEELLQARESLEREMSISFRPRLPSLSPFPPVSVSAWPASSDLLEDAFQVA